MTPDEVMRLASDQAIVRTDNRYPMKLRKIYFDEPAKTAQANKLGEAKGIEISPLTAKPMKKEAAVPPAPKRPNLDV